MKILLAKPRGFCAGVDRAIEIVEKALDYLGAPIYVRHEVVHNAFVVEGLKKRGAIFTDEIEEVPIGSTVIFSAHGVSQAVRQAARVRKLRVFDATCPLVTKVHLEVARCSKAGKECILIGHAGHPEVEGTMGQYSNKNSKIYLVENETDAEKIQVADSENLALVTQTTLSVDDTAKIIKILRQRFPKISAPKLEDICYATQNRQDAVKQLAKQCEVVLVVGSPNSSNSNRLRELAERLGCRAYLIDHALEIKSEWLEKVNHVGVTAGASAPDILVQEVVQYLKTMGADVVIESQGIEEKIIFALPKELRQIH